MSSVSSVGSIDDEEEERKLEEAGDKLDELLAKLEELQTNPEKVVLQDNIEQLRNFNSNEGDEPPPMEALNAIFSVLGREQTPADLIASNANTILEVVLDAAKASAVANDPKFQREAGKIFSALLEGEGKDDILTSFFVNNGLNHCLEVMESHQSRPHVLLVYCGLLVDVLGNVPNEHVAEVNAVEVFEVLLRIIEFRTDGITFYACSRAMNVLLDSGVELAPELSERITKCTVNAITQHKHHEVVHEAGRHQLELVLGPEQAKEILLDVPTDGPFVSKEVADELMMVIAFLGVADSAEDLEMAIEFLFHLVADDNNDTEAFKGLLVSMNVIEALIAATKLDDIVTPHFLHGLGGSIFPYFVTESEERSTLFLNNGGFERYMEILQSDYISEVVVAVSFMNSVASLILSLPDEKRGAISLEIFQLALAITMLDFYKENEIVYTNACWLMWASIGPHMEGHENLRRAAIQRAYDGILKFPHDEYAQENGRLLLTTLAGEELARDMIEHAEMHHRNECNCAGAA